MLVRPRLIRARDGRLALVNATYVQGGVVKVEGPFQAISDPGASPEDFMRAFVQLMHEAVHASLPLTGWDDPTGGGNETE